MFRWSEACSLRIADLPWHTLAYRKATTSFAETPDSYSRSRVLHQLPSWTALTSLINWLFATGPEPLQPLVGSFIIHPLIYNLVYQPDLQCTGYFSMSVVNVRCCSTQSSHFPRLLRLHGLKGVSECHVVGTKAWRWFSVSCFLLKPNILFMPAWSFGLYLNSIAVWTESFDWFRPSSLLLYLFFSIYLFAPWTSDHGALGNSPSIMHWKSSGTA